MESVTGMRFTVWIARTASRISKLFSIISASALCEMHATKSFVEYCLMKPSFALKEERTFSVTSESRAERSTSVRSAVTSGTLSIRMRQKTGRASSHAFTAFSTSVRSMK